MQTVAVLILIMRAREFRPNHAAFIESMMVFGGGEQYAYIEATIGVLMAMVSLEVGQWIG